MPDVTCYRYRIPLANALPGPDGPITHREGVLVEVPHPSGATCWGEAAPLPGFSPEPLQDVISRARAWAHDGGPSRLSASDAARYPDDTPGSLRFALDHIALQWAAYTEEISLRAHMGIDRVMHAGNALWRTPSDRDMRQALMELQAEGVSTVKVKVGRDAVDDDLDRLDALFASLPQGMNVRLDANQAWSVEQAQTVCEALQHRRALEYLEEPLVPEADLRAFVEATAVPIALDETVREQGGEAVADWPVAALVVKPAWMGIRRVQELADQAGDTPVVVTSAYESGVGWRGALAVGAQVTPAERAIGMGTYRALSEEITHPPIPNVQGKLLLTAPGTLDDWQVRRGRLQVV